MPEKNYIICGSRTGACFHLLLKFYSHCITNNLEFGGLIVYNDKDETREGLSNKNAFEIKDSVCRILGLPNVISYDKSLNFNNIKIARFREDKDYDEKYFNTDFIKILHDSCSIYRHIKVKYLNVGIHIRRGDILPGFCRGAERYLYNKYYIDLINLIKTMNNNCVINIYSEKKSYESFEDFKLLNCNLYLDTKIDIVFSELINSDIFIMSRSSFSYVPAIYNKNILIYHPFWHGKFENWLDVTDENFEEQLKNSLHKYKNIMEDMNNNIIFIHIPKTAGYTIGRCLRDIGVLKKGYGFNHGIARKVVKKEDKECIIMAVVRNPYDRLYSIYEFYSKKRNNIDKSISFEKFVLTFEKDYYLRGEPFNTCFDFLSDSDNKLMPTDILHFETLHNDYNLFCEKYKIKNNLIYRNINYEKETNISWSNLYTLQMRNIVERIFKLDLITFNYSYEQFLTEKNAILK